MDPGKVSTILEWLEPRKIKDVQSFLGFANFYRGFISDYSKITVPLTCLTCKGTPWDFSDACQSSFESLKKAFTTAPVLARWSPRDPLIVETETSDYALGAILSTINPLDNQVHPIAFHSWTKLRCAWQITPGHLQSIQVLAPLPRRNSDPNRYHHRLLSGRTLHRVGLENWSWRKGLGFNLCVAPPNNRTVPNFGVTEFMEFMMIFQSIPEETEKTE